MGTIAFNGASPGMTMVPAGVMILNGAFQVHLRELFLAQLQVEYVFKYFLEDRAYSPQ